MNAHGKRAALATAAVLLSVSPGRAAPAAEAAPAAIRAALLRWTAAFNARRADDTCTLFAPDLRYQFGGGPERDFRQQCDRLHTVLADRAISYSYAPPAIAEILVSGDIAIVRLTWTLTAASASAGAATVTRERSMDVFRRAPDGAWRIVRYLAFELPPP